MKAQTIVDSLSFLFFCRGSSLNKFKVKLSCSHSSRHINFRVSAENMIEYE